MPDDHRNPADDERIYLRLGIAIAEAQLLELALTKLAEAQRYDLAQPLDDRWGEIETWLSWNAGRLKDLLHVPDLVAEDVGRAVDRRNRIAHDTWKAYSVGADSRASADEWAPWLDDETTMLMQVKHGLIELRDRVQELRSAGESVEDADLERVWREYVPHPIAPRPDR